MSEQSTDGNGEAAGATASTGNGQGGGGRFVLTLEQRKRACEAFEGALDNAAPAYEVGQLEMFHAEHEKFIREEVERKLYEPQLPNGSQRERRMIERLKRLAMDREWAQASRVGLAIAAWERVLSEDPKNAGRYYIRRPVTPKLDKDFYQWLMAKKLAAHAAQEWDKKWYYEMLLPAVPGKPHSGGLPEAVSNFRLDCLFLLRKSDGSVDRLVQLRNVLGEVSRGPHHQGSDILDAEAFASPEKFRRWALARGNFAWSGNQTDLHKLHEDNTHLAAWKVINQVDSVGWLAVKRVTKVAAGWAETLGGIWFCDECAYADGQVLLPDEDGIYWWQGEGYYLNRKGRESDFSQGRPKMRPSLTVVKKDGVWELAPRSVATAREARAEAELIAELYREVTGRFYESIGGYEGWLAIGAFAAYAAAPEIFEEYGLFPGFWIHGQMESGKTKTTEWLMHLWGFTVSSGIGLLKGSAVGLQQECENYSNLPLWADEYRQAQVKEDKEAVLRDSYNRQPPVKWTPDGIQRKMRTSFVVSGESTSSDAAMRSRFPHVQVSAAKRLGNHLDWMDQNKGKFFVLMRLLLERREVFVAAVRQHLQEWLTTALMKGVNEREKMVHGIDYAAFEALTGLVEEVAQGAAVLNAREGVGANVYSGEARTAFLTFMAEHAKGSAADVSSETNINVFLTDLLTAVKADAISASYFRVEKTRLDSAPGRPNQKGWDSYRVYMDPGSVISALNIYLAKERRSVTLRRNDLRDQLSKSPGWIGGKLTKRFGSAGDMTSTKCWGFELDRMELGYQACTDEEVDAFLLHQGSSDGDPRLGPFYALVNWLEAAERARLRAEA